jgi:hypothetical protein
MKKRLRDYLLTPPGKTLSVFAPVFLGLLIALVLPCVSYIRGGFHRSQKIDAPILQMKEYIEVKKKLLDDLKPEYRKDGEFILDWFIKDVCPDLSKVKDLRIENCEHKWDSAIHGPSRYGHIYTTSVLIQFQEDNKGKKNKYGNTDDHFVHYQPLFVNDHCIVRIKLYYDAWLSCNCCEWDQCPELNKEIMEAVDRVKKINPNCVVEQK